MGYIRRCLFVLLLVLMGSVLCGCYRSVSAMSCSLSENIDSRNLKEALLESAYLLKNDKTAFINVLSSKDMASLDSPFYFLMALATFDRDKEESMEWYFTGYLCGMYDAFRCEDKSARQGLLVMISMGPEVAQYAINFSKDEPEKFSEIVGRSIQRADAYHLGGDPYWICWHGIKSFKEAPQLVPQSDWEAIYVDKREALAKSAHVKGAPQHN